MTLPAGIYVVSQLSYDGGTAHGEWPANSDVMTSMQTATKVKPVYGTNDGRNYAIVRVGPDSLGQLNRTVTIGDKGVLFEDISNGDDDYITVGILSVTDAVQNSTKTGAPNADDYAYLELAKHSIVTISDTELTIGTHVIDLAAPGCFATTSGIIVDMAANDNAEAYDYENSDLDELGFIVHETNDNMPLEIAQEIKTCGYQMLYYSRRPVAQAETPVVQTPTAQAQAAQTQASKSKPSKAETTNGPKTAASKFHLADREPVALAIEAAARATTINELYAEIKAYKSHEFAVSEPVGIGQTTPHPHPIMIVTEKPEAGEIERGMPLTGENSIILHNIMLELGIEQKDVHIAYAIHWTPPGEKAPNNTIIAASRPFLYREIELVQPRAILAVGRHVVDALTGYRDQLTPLLGQTLQFKNDDQQIPAYVVWHPAFLNRFATKLHEYFTQVKGFFTVHGREEDHTAISAPIARDKSDQPLGMQGIFNLSPELQAKIRAKR